MNPPKDNDKAWRDKFDELFFEGDSRIPVDLIVDIKSFIQSAIDKAVEEAFEEAAKVASEYIYNDEFNSFPDFAKEIAKAIRNLSKQNEEGK